MTITIERATKDAIDEIYNLVEEQANETNTSDEVINFNDDLSDAWDNFCCLIARDEKKTVVGYAIFTEGFHVWRGSYLCLEQLYVRPKNRQQKIAQQILKEVFAIARAENKKTVRWETPPENDRANSLYMKIGAELAVRHRYNFTIEPA